MGNQTEQFNDAPGNIAAAGVFTSTARDSGNNPGLPGGAGFSRFRVMFKCSQPGVLEIMYSKDNVAAYRTTFSVVTTTGPAQIYESLVCLRYGKLKWTNNGVLTTSDLAINSTLVAV